MIKIEDDVYTFDRKITFTYLYDLARRLTRN